MRSMRSLYLLVVSAVLALTVAGPAYASDVHVRVDPGAPHANPGDESQTVFPTIQNALDHYPVAKPNPDGTPGRVFIEVSPGTYHERLKITENHPNVTLIGMGKSAQETTITNALNAKTAGGTFLTATVEVDAPGFEADNLTIENSAGNTGQAVALANRSDRSILKHCRLLGHQDTLFADYGRQYYVDSYIEGGVDYIFGNAAAVFERDELHSNGPGFITAQSRTAPEEATGYVILNSRITADLGGSAPPAEGAAGTLSTAAAHKTIGLGRPWRPYARVVFINTKMPVEMNPVGWNNWGRTENESTAYYGEYKSTGPGASPSTRAPWAHQLTDAEMKQYLPQTFLAGTDHWDAVAEAAKLP